MCELAALPVKCISPFQKMYVCFASPLGVVYYLHDSMTNKNPPVMIWLMDVLKYECFFCRFVILVFWYGLLMFGRGVYFFIDPYMYL